MLEMLVNILNMDMHILAYLVGARGAKLATLTAQHDSALGNRELGMGDAATWTRSAQALGKTEGIAEPVDRLLYVFVDQDGYHCCSRCRPIDHHTDLPIGKSCFEKTVTPFLQRLSTNLSDARCVR